MVPRGGGVGWVDCGGAPVLPNRARLVYSVYMGVLTWVQLTDLSSLGPVSLFWSEISLFLSELILTFFIHENDTVKHFLCNYLDISRQSLFFRQSPSFSDSNSLLHKGGPSLTGLNFGVQIH